MTFGFLGSKGGLGLLLETGGTLWLSLDLAIWNTSESLVVVHHLLIMSTPNKVGVYPDDIGRSGQLAWTLDGDVALDGQAAEIETVVACSVLILTPKCQDDGELVNREVLRRTFRRSDILIFSRIQRAIKYKGLQLFEIGVDIELFLETFRNGIQTAVQVVARDIVQVEALWKALEKVVGYR